MAPFSRRTSTVGGWGDLIATPAALHWQFDRFHVLGAFSIYAPTGSYDKNRMLNIGRNIWAFEPDVGVTWLNEETGREASAFVGYTVNLENTATHYASGNEFHADFALAQHLPHGFLLGAAGYAFQQTTADRGRGSVLGPFMGRVFALGPIAGYSLRTAHNAVNFTAKYQFEFADHNRLTGDVLWLTAMLAF